MILNRHGKSFVLLLRLLCGIINARRRHRSPQRQARVSTASPGRDGFPLFAPSSTTNMDTPHSYPPTLTNRGLSRVRDTSRPLPPSSPHPQPSPLAPAAPTLSLSSQGARLCGGQRYNNNNNVHSTPEGALRIDIQEVVCLYSVRLRVYVYAEYRHTRRTATHPSSGTRMPHSRRF